LCVRTQARACARVRSGGEGAATILVMRCQQIFLTLRSSQKY